VLSGNVDKKGNVPKKKFNVASFFAGIGGFDLGFEQAGFQVSLQCEIHDYCVRVLKRHWPSTPLARDIAKLDAKTVPDVDVWCGGFPCQDLSVARGARGRRGLNGSRSGLFFPFAALAKKKKPPVILLENVHGLLNSNYGKDFAQLLYELDRLGYAVSWRVLNSRYFGVPQSRPRIYICAWQQNPTAAGDALFEDRPPSPLANERQGFLETSWQGEGPIVPKIGFCLSATSGRHTGTDWSRTYVAYADEVRRLTPLECERIQGFPDGWTSVNQPEIDIERVDTLRYHALGNAVSVSVVKWLATRIHVGLEHRRKSNTSSKRKSFVESARRWPGLIGAGHIVGDLRKVLKNSEKVIWPSAGIVWKSTFIANRTPPAPHRPSKSDLLDLIERRRPDGRYFLSSNAAEGILRRVDSQERHLFPPLRQALERLAGRPAMVYDLSKSARQLELRLNEPACA
jgi:DNA (cytosine-5)-methyltransferase 1